MLLNETLTGALRAFYIAYFIWLASDALLNAPGIYCSEFLLSTVVFDVTIQSLPFFFVTYRGWSIEKHLRYLRTRTTEEIRKSTALYRNGSFSFCTAFTYLLVYQFLGMKINPVTRTPGMLSSSNRLLGPHPYGKRPAETPIPVNV